VLSKLFAYIKHITELKDILHSVWEELPQDSNDKTEHALKPVLEALNVNVLSDEQQCLER